MLLLMDAINGRHKWKQLMAAINAVINDECH
jgi:hypothetical protein